MDVYFHSANCALRRFGTAFSTLILVYVDRQPSRTFRPLRRFESMTIATIAVKFQNIYSEIHALRLPLCSYALRLLHYSNNGIFLVLYHLFHNRALCFPVSTISVSIILLNLKEILFDLPSTRAVLLFEISLSGRFRPLLASLWVDVLSSHGLRLPQLNVTFTRECSNWIQFQCLQRQVPIWRVIRRTERKL